MIFFRAGLICFQVNTGGLNSYNLIYLTILEKISLTCYCSALQHLKNLPLITYLKSVQISEIKNYWR